MILIARREENSFNLIRHPCTLHSDRDSNHTAPNRPISNGTAHRGLWFAFGHNHHALTLGPITRRLRAEMMCGEPTIVDAKPFRVQRF